ncbi:MAG TPA: pentapeptide repeat-containing protein [Sphingobium sp.]
MNPLSEDRTLLGQSLSRAEVARLAEPGRPLHLVDCTLEGVDLSSLDLSGWIWERCDVRRVDFTGARLGETIWRSCRGAFATFLGTDLAEAQFFGCDLNNSVFRRSILSTASFEGCKLTGADLSEAKAFDVRFQETLMINAKLPAWSFRKQTLKRVDFGQADLRKCDFRDVVFEACSLRDAHMTGCKFDHADLRGADLGGLRLIDAALFRGATISREQAGQLLGELGLNVR